MNEFEQPRPDTAGEALFDTLATIPAAAALVSFGIENSTRPLTLPLVGYASIAGGGLLTALSAKRLDSFHEIRARARRIELYKPLLGELRPGHYPFNVPLDHGAVRMDMLVREETPFVPLSVDIDEASIRLKRDDGQKLQVDNSPESLGPPKLRGASWLFDKAIKQLALHSSEGPEGTYHVEGKRLKLKNPKGFDSFLTQVFLHIYRLQNPEADAAVMLAVLDSYDEF